MVMKRGVLLVMALMLASPMMVASAGEIGSRAAFERLKVLVGTWDATEKGHPGFSDAVTYAMTGRGSVLMEHFQAPTTAMGHMLTAYHLEVDRLVLTHFCGAGNQPRMRVKAFDDGGRHIAFEMSDITNLASPIMHCAHDGMRAYHSPRSATAGSIVAARATPAIVTIGTRIAGAVT